MFTGSQALLRIGLWGLGTVGLPGLVSSRHSGIGGILSFHRIYEAQSHEFGSQAASVSPRHFRHLLGTLVAQGYTFLSMSGLVERLTERGGQHRQRKVVCLTFDDGYVDSYTAAYPICRDFGVPMTVYLVSGIIRREFPMWSLVLEEVLAANECLELTWCGEMIKLNCRGSGEKRTAYFALASRLACGSTAHIQQACTELAVRYGVDPMTLTDRNALAAPMIAEMQQSGLVEFGAHSVHHPRLGDLDETAARCEIEQSKRDCESLSGVEVRHFAYPYGDAKAAGVREATICRKLGFHSAVTTESNTIFETDRERLMGLPRLTYNGNFQSAHMLDLLLSGALPLLKRRWNAGRLS